MKVIYTKGFLNDMERLFSSNWWYAIPRFFSDIKFRIKETYLRVTRGYDNEAVWGHYHWISEVNSKIFKDLTEKHWGHPAGISDKKWKEILMTIANGFSAAKSIGNLDYIDDFGKDKNIKKQRNKERELKRKFDKGMKLYHKWFFSIWD